jgi:hypothetical protein
MFQEDDVIDYAYLHSTIKNYLLAYLDASIKRHYNQYGAHKHLIFSILQNISPGILKFFFASLNA